MSTLEAIPTFLKGQHPASPRSSQQEGVLNGLEGKRAKGNRSPAPPSTQDRAYESVLHAVFSILLNAQPAVKQHWHADAQADEVESPPEALYVAAAALLGARRTSQAAEVLRRLEFVAAPRSDGQPWKGRSEFLWAIHAEQTADDRGVLRHCAAASEFIEVSPLLARDPRHYHERDDLLRRLDIMVASQVAQLTARAHLGLGQLHRAQADLENRYEPTIGGRAAHTVTRAMLACHQGRLGDALLLGTQALQADSQGSIASEPVHIDARLVLAEVFYERNQLDAAQEQLQAAFRLCCLTSATQPMWAVDVHLARLSVAQNRAEQAIPRVERLLQVRDGGFLAEPLARKLTELQIDCQLQLGDIDGAVLVAQRSPVQEIGAETLARIDLYSGRPDRVLTRLSADRSVGLTTQIRRLILLACAENQQGRTQRASDTIQRALAAAESEGYVRPFLEQALQTLPLLRSLRKSSGGSYLSRLVDEVDRCVPHKISKKHAILEPLTERERQVLQYLPSHLTMRQIASRMYLTTNTIKTHVKAVYRKIGAESRDDAVSIARAHGLV